MKRVNCLGIVAGLAWALVQTAQGQDPSPAELVASEGFEMSIPHAEGRIGGSSVRLNNGDILLAYAKPFNLRGSPLGTVRLYGVVSKNGGETWENERLIEHNPACQTGRPSFLRTQDGAIWIFYYGFVHYDPDDEDPAGSAQSDLWAIRCMDEGTTWGGRQRIFEGYTGATNGAIQTSSGNIVVPFSYMAANPMRFISTTVVSTDNGETWQLANGIDFRGKGGTGDHSGALEPVVVERKDGSIWMVIRTTRGEFWESVSKDGGLTWGKPEPTDIVSTSAPAHITRLASGRLCMAWNHGHPNVDTNRRGFITAGRQGLYLSLSNDDGESWLAPVLAARAREVSYPYILESEPGELLISTGRLRAAGMDTDTIVLRTTEQRLLGDTAPQ